LYPLMENLRYKISQRKEDVYWGRNGGDFDKT
jgi:hypothetical protein